MYDFTCFTLLNYLKNKMWFQRETRTLFMGIGLVFLLLIFRLATTLSKKLAQEPSA